MAVAIAFCHTERCYFLLHYLLLHRKVSLFEG